MIYTGMVELVNQAVVRELRVLLHLITIEEVNNQKDSVCNMFSGGHFLLCNFRFEHRIWLTNLQAERTQKWLNLSQKR